MARVDMVMDMRRISGRAGGLLSARAELSARASYVGSPLRSRFGCNTRTCMMAVLIACGISLGIAKDGF